MPMCAPCSGSGTGWQDHESWVGSQSVDTIYFGGGTPSRLDPGGTRPILERIAADRERRAVAEVTLEANPDDVTHSGRRLARPPA